MSLVLGTRTSLFSVNICYINFQCTELFLSEITIILQLSVCLFKQTCKGYHSKSRWPPHGVDDVPLEVVQVLLVGGVGAAVLHVSEVPPGQARHQLDVPQTQRWNKAEMSYSCERLGFLGLNDVIMTSL